MEAIARAFGVPEAPAVLEAAFARMVEATFVAVAVAVAVAVVVSGPAPKHVCRRWLPRSARRPRRQKAASP